MVQFEPSDFALVEDFVCSNTKFQYKSDMYYDQYRLGDNIYSIHSIFDAKC